MAFTGAVVGTAMVLSACGGKVDANNDVAGGGDIKIGTITDRSGPTVGNQNPWLHGFEAVVKRTNDAGGVGGKRIVLQSEDDKFDAGIGLAAYKELVSQKVVAIAGLGASDVQLAIEPLAEKEGIPLLAGQTTTKKMLVPTHEHFFAITPSYAEQADVSLGYAKQLANKPNPRIAVVTSGVSSGVELADLVKETDGQGYVFGGNFTLPASSTSADAVIQSVASSKADAIIFHGSSTTTNLALKSQAKLGLKIPMVGITAIATPKAFADVDQDTADLLQPILPVTPGNVEVPGTADMKAAADAAGFGAEVADPSFVLGYLNGVVLVEALGKAGPNVTTASLTKALIDLKSLDTKGLSGDFSYSASHKVGLTQLRPYKWNVAAKGFEPVGEYADYAQYVTNRYASK